MSGLVVFNSLSQAIANGYQVYDRTAEGYLVRTRLDNRWALAVVRVAK
jgi:hypothetical protein